MFNKVYFLALFVLVFFQLKAQDEKSFHQLMNLPIQKIQKNGELYLKGNFTEILTGKSEANLKSSGSKGHDHEDYDIYYKTLNDAHPSIQTIQKYMKQASFEFNVPYDILNAIAKGYNNYTMAGPSMYNSWGIMGLVDGTLSNTLADGAKLIGVTKDKVKFDARQNIRAMAALLSHYYGKHKVRNPQDILSWLEALKTATGLAEPELREMQAIAYLKILNNGSQGEITLWKEKTDFIGRKNNEITSLITDYEERIAKEGLFPQKSNKEGVTTEGATTGTPDYPGAIASFTDCNQGSRGSTDIDTWVNHYLATGTVPGAISWFRQCRPSATTSSAHFIVDTDGKIYQCVKVSANAYHAGASGTTNNSRSIGTEHAVYSSNPSAWNNTTLLKASTDMARFFCNKYAIAKTRSLPGIRGHKEMPGTNTDCPNILPWTTWMNMLNNGGTVSNTPTTVNPANNATGTARPVTFIWTTPVNATQFRLQVSTSNSGWNETDGFTAATTTSSTIVVNASLANTLNFTWIDGVAGTFEGPRPSTSYYYTLRSFDQTSGTSKYTPVKKFTTDRGVLAISPAPNANTSTPVKLSWNSTVTGGSYRLQISKVNSGWTAANGFTADANPTTNVPVNISGGGLLNYTWQSGSAGSNAAPVVGTSYYWTVRVFSSATGTSDYSPVRKFTVTAAAARIMQNSEFDSKDLIVYPNPAQDYIQVEVLGDISGKSNIQIIDFQGNVLKSVDADSKKIDLDVKNIKDGLYILRVQNSSGIKTTNIIIKK
ncbi:MAG: N-acetylmuramoyl-L-alanine amidase [Raineya sp.]|jgi:hypothetical protein|nr:N-acetylmuramoyl-L-alanine amidase [Raineya sp.]